MKKTTDVSYDNEAALQGALVGRSIVKTEVIGELGSFAGRIAYTLDDGTVFEAVEADGGCACSNGCFAITPGTTPENVITDIKVRENNREDSWDDGLIEMFVYSAGEEFKLFSSAGHDNGYYGWGHRILVTREQ